MNYLMVINQALVKVLICLRKSESYPPPPPVINNKLHLEITTGGIIITNNTSSRGINSILANACLCNNAFSLSCVCGLNNNSAVLRSARGAYEIK